MMEGKEAPKCPECGKNNCVGVNGFSNTGPLTYKVRYVCRRRHPATKGWLDWSVVGEVQNYPSPL